MPPAQLTDDAQYSSFLCYAEWKRRLPLLLDNVMDPMHGTFLHKQSHSMAEGDTTAQFGIRATRHGFVFEKEGQRNVNFDWTEWVDTGTHWVRLEIPYPTTGGPGGNFGIVGVDTPIDERIVRLPLARAQGARGWERDTWRFLYKTRLEARHWHVLEQDREMLDGCKPGIEKYEMLYQHDAGVIRLRRYLAQQARKQLADLQAAGKM